MSEFNRSSTLTLRGSTNTALRQRRIERPRASASSAPHGLPAASASAREQRVVGSDALLQGQTHVLIAHNGETYQLRATRLGKLILTK
ncbi:hemin uptake protein HemP [Trinickia caryophylli]|uniref:hemin uptake protein HemP n=1 Tax=Trinickia caryophylli TaxID=28094 RepID=UPI000A14EA85|nr:hemin uptake protein HemP [Trinickia caryophylli]PMS11305.1 hemin uptake protein HemP [Trinickia caryophylli]TRX16785.1 hemin uptake protein HemP [Trinickia caryophylli]WQE12490.1 hemin uptake protein HemP [Trinickia caryophylli]